MSNRKILIPVWSLAALLWVGGLALLAFTFMSPRPTESVQAAAPVSGVPDDAVVPASDATDPVEAAANETEDVWDSDVPYVPTPRPVVRRMIEMAEVQAGDVVYDLGCGDGRIVIAAVSIPGVRGVCVDIDPVRIHESRTNAARAGVEDRIRFVQGDLFETPLHDATVVTLYLLSSVNMKLRPRLLELDPGTRIVSHEFGMGDWRPERQVFESGSVIYRWTVPRPAERGGL